MLQTAIISDANKKNNTTPHVKHEAAIPLLQPFLYSGLGLGQQIPSKPNENKMNNNNINEDKISIA